eukprot:CAMPEP_0115693036 /NCGR_PEP_ID=MMETSP0272-20121206/63514_1 /TAXON_ID=71861 /ORGANISM="Scrippsiella trochoidea, Strain CCMP3099" /LENGTH=142 /DNA_ID=CAMNT_0003133133 /DNA_START=166 /DNA_END=593 /DNA_ORIENTATION=-
MTSRCQPATGNLEALALADIAAKVSGFAFIAAEIDFRKGLLHMLRGVRVQNLEIESWKLAESTTQRPNDGSAEPSKLDVNIAKGLVAAGHEAEVASELELLWHFQEACMHKKAPPEAATVLQPVELGPRVAAVGVPDRADHH